MQQLIINYYKIIIIIIPQGSVLGPWLFNTFINNLSNVIKHSKYLLFAKDVKIFHAINSVDDCILLQSDIKCTQGWCPGNLMKLNSSKTRVIAFTKKTYVLHYTYKLLDSSITHRDTNKDLWVKLDSKLYFHVHVD